jgi:hypothetical protein
MSVVFVSQAAGGPPSRQGGGRGGGGAAAGREGCPQRDPIINSSVYSFVLKALAGTFGSFVTPGRLWRERRLSLLLLFIVVVD